MYFLRCFCVYSLAHSGGTLQCKAPIYFQQNEEIFELVKKSSARENGWSKTTPFQSKKQYSTQPDNPLDTSSTNKASRNNGKPMPMNAQSRMINAPPKNPTDPATK